MVRRKPEERTRQVYASVREELYLAAKGQAARLRVSLREYIEMALEQALSGQQRPPATLEPPSVWEDEYLRMQASQPLGSPAEMTRDEAAKVVKAAFGLHVPKPAPGIPGKSVARAASKRVSPDG